MTDFLERLAYDESERKRVERQIEDAIRDARTNNPGKLARAAVRALTSGVETDLLGKPLNVKTPYTTLVNLYHQHTNLPRVRKITAARKRTLDARWREHPSLKWWQRYFDYVSCHGFLKGDNGRGWMADLDFLLRESTMTKVLEGFYQNDEDEFPQELTG